MNDEEKNNGKIAGIYAIFKYKKGIEYLTSIIKKLDNQFIMLHDISLLEDIEFKNVENMLYNKLVEVIRLFKKSNVDYLFFYDENSSQYFISDFLEMAVSSYQAILNQAIEILMRIDKYIVDHDKDLINIFKKRALQIFKRDLFNESRPLASVNNEIFENIRKMYREYNELLREFYEMPFINIYIENTLNRLDDYFGGEAPYDLCEKVLALYDIDRDFLRVFKQEECANIIDQAYQKFLLDKGYKDPSILRRERVKIFTESIDNDFNPLEYLNKNSKEIFMDMLRKFENSNIKISFL